MCKHTLIVVKLSCMLICFFQLGRRSCFVFVLFFAAFLTKNVMLVKILVKHLKLRIRDLMNILLEIESIESIIVCKLFNKSPCCCVTTIFTSSTIVWVNYSLLESIIRNLTCSGRACAKNWTSKPKSSTETRHSKNSYFVGYHYLYKCY